MMLILNAVILFFALRAAYSAAAVIMLRLERRHGSRAHTGQLDTLNTMLDRRTS